MHLKIGGGMLLLGVVLLAFASASVRTASWSLMAAGVAIILFEELFGERLDHFFRRLFGDR